MSERTVRLERLPHAALVAILALGVSACGFGSERGGSPAESAPQASGSHNGNEEFNSVPQDSGSDGNGTLGRTPQEAEPSSSEPYAIQFDDLGGGSSIIQTYRGSGTDPASREPSGFNYNNGDIIQVDCYEIGRDVFPDTAAGEKGRASDKWYRFVPAAGQLAYTPDIYANPYPEGSIIPECQN